MVTVTSPVRVRFAPSPTGHLHIGGLRTALFNWLFARHHRGVFVLRIEDTDIERSKPEFTASILDSFKWLGIESDEPIVIQSQRVKRHQQVIDGMLQAGTAYRCYCTQDELQQRLGAGASHDGGYIKYDRLCRSLIGQEINKPSVIRFKMPDIQESISWQDIIHGTISFESDQFDDFIIARSGHTAGQHLPLYNFVVVVDDADMNITHVIRGEDHIINTPKQILLYRACGFTVPLFAHAPSILGADGSKLSKRDAATSVLDYRTNGFLPQALENYLVRLGWSYGNQEIFSREELIALFDLDQVGKKGAIFDTKKLEWLNGVYIKNSSGSNLLNYALVEIDPDFLGRVKGWDCELVVRLCELYKERVKTIRELLAEIESLYQDPVVDKNYFTEDAKTYLKLLYQELDTAQDFSSAALSILLKKLYTRLGVALPVIAKPLRMALTGKEASPGVCDLAALLGKQETLTRLKRVLE